MYSNSALNNKPRYFSIFLDGDREAVSNYTPQVLPSTSPVWYLLTHTQDWRLWMSWAYPSPRPKEKLKSISTTKGNKKRGQNEIHHIYWKSGVNFINVFTRSFYTSRSQRRKKLLDLTLFFALTGSAIVKAARIMMVKLTPECKMYARERREKKSLIFETFSTIFFFWATNCFTPWCDLTYIHIYQGSPTRGPREGPMWPLKSRKNLDF